MPGLQLAIGVGLRLSYCEMGTAIGAGRTSRDCESWGHCGVCVCAHIYGRCFCRSWTGRNQGIQVSGYVHWALTLSTGRGGPWGRSAVVQWPLSGNSTVAFMGPGGETESRRVSRFAHSCRPALGAPPLTAGASPGLPLPHPGYTGRAGLRPASSKHAHTGNTGPDSPSGPSLWSAPPASFGNHPRPQSLSQACAGRCVGLAWSQTCPLPCLSHEGLEDACWAGAGGHHSVCGGRGMGRVDWRAGTSYVSPHHGGLGRAHVPDHSVVTEHCTMCWTAF